MLPGRLVHHRTFGRKFAPAMCHGTVIFGLILLSAAVPFRWYRVDIGPETLAIREFPDARAFRRRDFKSVDVMPGGPVGRIRVELDGGKAYFVNDSGIGGDDFRNGPPGLRSLHGSRTSMTYRPPGWAPALGGEVDVAARLTIR